MRFSVPPPHVAVHADQSVHAPQKGQALSSLQVSVNVAWPTQEASLPPGAMHCRILVLLPLPQVVEHSVQSDHSVQYGHSVSLHSSTSVSSPGQKLSSPVSGSRHCRNRRRIPPPQVCVHSVQSDHVVHVGHSEVLHSSTTTNGSLHGLVAASFPSCRNTSDGSLHCRIFFRKPPPHVWVQGDQSDQSVRTGHASILQGRLSRSGAWQGLSESRTAGMPHSR